MSERITTANGLTVGLDLGDRFTEGRVVDGSGVVVEGFRGRTTEAALPVRLAGFAPSRVVLELGTHSPWVSRAVTRLGHEAVKSRSVGAYVGLWPRQRDSGDQSPQLRITKAGDRLLRCLLVSCAHYILGPFGPDNPRTSVCTDLNAGHRECGWKPGGSFVGDRGGEVATATRRGATSRLDEAGLLMETAAADEPQPVPVDLW